MFTEWSMFGAAVHVEIPSELQDEASLLKYLGLSPAELKKIWYHRERMYADFDVSKKNGKLRQINAPNRRLKYIQRLIATKLDLLYRHRKPAHGYMKDRSVKTNASSHLKQRYVLNLDIKDFFISITEPRVEGVLIAVGVPNRVSAVIAKICGYSGRLPQGGPASPVLSNMICFRLDRALLRIAKDAKCIYTRYADDITLSGLRPLSPLFKGVPPPSGPVTEELLSAALQSAFNSNGFKINHEKIHYADKNSRRIVTGLKINEGLNVDRRFVRNIRSALYAAEKDMPAAQARYMSEFGGSSTIAAHLKGKIAWLGNIKGLADPVYRSLALRFNKSFASQPIKVQPTREEKIDRSVWVVEHGLVMKDIYRQGSVFFLEDVGLVTAAHCVEGVTDATIHHPSRPSNKFEVKVAHYSKHRDLAILSHAIPKTDFYKLKKSIVPSTTGDLVTAVGYPDFGPSDKINFRPGTVSSTTIKSSIALLEVNFKLAQGMSGGPVLNASDAVVGIIHKGGVEMSRDFAIVVTELDKWIADGLADDT